ncbi:MAG TPA: oxygen-dependent coproporphyrinogen oxidase [Bacteriovoracaceae bacterium]|nr:oxygen-dependent coproporphyrinogen oxidase [Bacteriovoracaceae bacterium]
MELDTAKENFHQHVRNLQERITQEMLRLDPTLVMKEDLWSRLDHSGNEGGGGRTRAFTGDLFENAGVNTSCVYGKIDPQFAKALKGSGDEMWATGISLILHPRSPRVPTVHANFRMIHQGEKHWFGGGADLTPYYPYEDDFAFFHGAWKKAAGPLYHDMKKTCDDYFNNAHRGIEMRGIGGIFFDHYQTPDLMADLDLVKDLSEHFMPSYFPLVQKRMGEDWTAADEDFMLHRRGRYVEFNLLHDRGTLFGLKTNGRVDSILISLPARCKFSYQYRPEVGSVHEKMWQYYQPRSWA